MDTAFKLCTAAEGQLLLSVYVFCYVVAESQSADVIVQGCDDPDNLCLIGRESLSRPIICLICRSAYLRMLFITIVAMVSEAFKPWVRFSKAIYIISILYRYHDRFDLKSKTSVSFPQF